MALGLLVAGGGSVAYASGWSKYVAPNRSFSFHYPTGWKVGVQGTMVVVVHPKTKEQLLVIFAAGAGTVSVDQLANRFIAAFKKANKTLRISNRRTLKKVLVVFNAKWKEAGKTNLGVGMVLKKGEIGIWGSYGGPKKHYVMQRGWGNLAGMISSFAQGTGSRPPRVKTRPRPRPTKEGPKITDKWFLPRGKKLRGFYGGAVLRKEMASSVSIGTNLPGTSYYHRTDAVTTGGDFRIAFYKDGTVRAKLMVLNYTPMISSNVPFHYKGRFKLRKNGQLKTRTLRLANKPRTFLRFEKRMTKMRLSGRYNKKTNTFIVQVSTYNPKKHKWSRLGKKVRLGRASRRRTTMFGTYKGGGGTTTYSR
jgi:hypothetical protein